MAVGVSDADASFVKGFIETTFKPSVCNSIGCRTSICDRYSDALKVSNEALLGTVVDGAIAKLTAVGAPTKKYFDGTKPSGSVDFTSPSNSALLTALRGKLIDFFWAPLGCTDDPAHVYTGRMLSDVHQPMMISQSEQDFFIGAVYDTLTGAGVTATDANVVRAVLQSLNPMIVNDASANQGPAIAETFIFSTVTKTAAHPQFMKGFPLGFAVNGTENPTIRLEVGKTYLFKSTAPCIHPVYFVEGSTGASVEPEVNSGISSSDYSQVCNSQHSITWTITKDLLGKTIYYNCRVHGSMGGPINICDTGACTGPIPPPPAATSICDKYSGTGTNQALLETVVDKVVTELVATDAPTRRYFDGTTPPGSTNFLTNTQRLTDLKMHLVQFFFGGLGCTKDKPALVYGGADMKTVHQAMGIAPGDQNYFVMSVHKVLVSLGVSEADAIAVDSVLHSFDKDIVTASQPPAPPGTTPPNPNTIDASAVGFAVAAVVGAIFAAIY